MFVIMLLFLLPNATCKVQSVKCFGNQPLHVPHKWFQPGDLTIGGIVSQIIYIFSIVSFDVHPSQKLGFELPIAVTKFYQHVLALAFAVKEINEDPQILSNITLGFHICDSYYDARMTYRTMLDLLFSSYIFVPNYQCGTRKYVITVIGGLGSDTSFHMSDILGLYKIPQLTYGSFALEESDAMKVASFHRLVPSEARQYKGIIQLLRHFMWTWIGLFIIDDDSGTNFLQVLEPQLSQNSICTAFTQRIPKQGRLLQIQELNSMTSKIYQPLLNEKVNVCVVYGETLTIMWLSTLISLADPENHQNATIGKVWIMTAQTEFTAMGILVSWDPQLFHGTFSFTIHSKEHQGFLTYLQSIKPDWGDANGFIQGFWEQAFDCAFPESQEPAEVPRSCTGEEKLDCLPSSIFEMGMTGHSYSIYNAVYAIAHALHDIQSLRSSYGSLGRMKRQLQDLQPWQLHAFLQGLSFNNSLGETLVFSDTKEIVAGFDIMNIITFPNKSFQRVKVGRVGSKASGGEEFFINDSIIEWHWIFNQTVPLSQCSLPCYPGYQKKKKEGEKFCCYDCVPCPEGKISNQVGITNCFTCPTDQYPNQKKDWCIPKTISFLSYEEPLGISLASLAITFSFATTLVLGTFIKYRDTPIIMANNRDLTYALLMSLLLCFLSSLLFIGQPRKLMCIFQKIVFGIIFSIAVSSVLVKTITVFIAFMAIKPGSPLRKWMRKRLTTSIVLSCSFIQASICAIWLSISPPFPDLDMQSETTEIIAKCNVGSAIMFYLVLGYMGLLSIISFVVAFLARKLPDTYNDAKFITFSMLIFCSVWLSFIPTYLSTKGKHMVAVEIFSILTSTAGLLGCIFIPKCYIVIFRPELNNREQLRRKN